MITLVTITAGTALFLGGGAFAIAAYRLEVQSRRLERRRAALEDQQAALYVDMREREERAPASRNFVMCGGCGANVETEDGFNPKFHTCYTPPLEGLPQRKIPIGVKGHLHTDRNLLEERQADLKAASKPTQRN